MSSYASALQALAVVTGAVALQQYAHWRKKHLAAATYAKAASQAHPKPPHPLPITSLHDTHEHGDDGPLFVVEIEYCTGCRWMLRAAWMAQELLTTFQTDATSRLRSVVLTPNARRGGVFEVYLHATDGSLERELLWSRKIAGRFPESKELKQIVRDYINPDKGLGHSDKK